MSFLPLPCIWGHNFCMFLLDSFCWKKFHIFLVWFTRLGPGLMLLAARQGLSETFLDAARSRSFNVTFTSVMALVCTGLRQAVQAHNGCLLVTSKRLSLTVLFSLPGHRSRGGRGFDLQKGL